MKPYHEEWEDVARTGKAHQAIATENYQNESVYNMSGVITVSSFLKLASHYYREKCNDMAMVEVGCGTGRETKYLADCFRKVVAIDTSATMIRKAKERMKKASVIFIKNEPGIIPMMDGEVDIVYSFIVFQHCPSDMVQSYFKEAYRTLKTGGRFIFQLGCTKNEDREPVNYADVGMRKEGTLRQELWDAGFIRVLINTSDHFGLHIAIK